MPETPKTLAESMRGFVVDYHNIRMGKKDRALALKTLEYLASQFERDGVIAKKDFLHIVYGE